MFCYKCGEQIAEGMTFCPKCGAKYVYTEDVQQPMGAATSADEPQQVAVDAPIITENTTYNQTLEENSARRKLTTIGRILMYGSMILLFFNFPISPAILVTGTAIGIILSIIVAKRPLGFNKILEFVVAVILLVVVAVFTLSSGGEGDSSSKGLDYQSDSGFTSNKIMIGKTMSYDDKLFGNIEVTLNYATFIDKYEDPLFENTLFGGYRYPDEGKIFLWADLTVKNIGTKIGYLPIGASKLVFDGAYEYLYHASVGSSWAWEGIDPLTPPIDVAIIFMVPTSVMESDKSLVLNIGDDGGKPSISYVIRSGKGITNSVQTPYNTRSVSSMDEAQKLVEDWLIDHPIGPLDGAGTGAAANDIPSISEKYFVLELWAAPRNFIGFVYVRKSDGYMTFHHSVTDMEYDLDAWYESEYNSSSIGYSNDLTFKSISLTDWIGGSADTAYDVFGWPDYGTVIDKSLYSGGEYFGYNAGITMYIDYRTEKIGWITGNAKAIEVNGVTLDMTRKKLVNLLGTNESEGAEYDELVGKEYYIMRYTIKGLPVNITLKDKNSSAISVLISQRS